MPITALLALAASTAQGQAFSKADSGWRPLFDGTTFDGLHFRMQGGASTDHPDPAFTIDSGMIKVTQGAGWKTGHLATDREYPHYRVRVEYRFTGTGGEAGLAYHSDETVTRTLDGRPRSIECRTKPGDAGRGYSIAMAAFSTLARADRYHPEGTLVDVCERTSDALCDADNYGPSAALDRPGEWNRLEAVVRGSDSAFHRVNDSTVFRLWNIRAPTGADSTAFAAFTAYGSGSLALLAQGTSLAYRNWEIMELPTDGPSTLQRLFLTNTDGGAELASGGTHEITWKTLGEVNKVSLFWHAGDGLWEMMADQITNTGSFAWTVPAVPTGSLRVKITAAPWVLADSSAGDNSIVPGAGIRGDVRAKVERLESGGGRDVKGRLIGADGRGARKGWIFRPSLPSKN